MPTKKKTAPKKTPKKTVSKAVPYAPAPMDLISRNSKPTFTTLDIFQGKLVKHILKILKKDKMCLEGIDNSFDLEDPEIPWENYIAAILYALIEENLIVKQINIPHDADLYYIPSPAEKAKLTQIKKLEAQLADLKSKL